MGRKSSSKKNRFQVRSLREQEENRQKKIAYLILFPGNALFIWGMILFEKTFISLQTIAIHTLVGAIIGITVLHLIWRYKKWRFLVTVFYGFFLGGSIPFSFIATTNYYLRSDHSENVRLEIVKIGTRRSSCRTPYAVIEYLHMEKTIRFPCDNRNDISEYKSLTLTVSKGFLGYMVYTDKKLNN